MCQPNSSTSTMVAEPEGSTSTGTRSRRTSSDKDSAAAEMKPAASSQIKSSTSSTARLTSVPEVQKPKTSSDLVTKLSDIELTDEKAERNEFHFRYFGLLDNFLIKNFMKDKRDLPLVYLQLNIMTFLVPFAAAVVYFNTWYLGLIYLPILFVGFFERFILMMHFSSHRKLYHSEFLNNITLYFYAPLFGTPPGIYYLHHIIMHHGENNHGDDVSETESYHRSERGFRGFLFYWLRFLCGLSFELPLYALKTKRYDWFATCLVSLSFWGATIFALGNLFGYTGVTCVLVIPHFFGLTAMALGNYAQHVFVDPLSPGNNYTLSYNCLNTEVNQTTFNDGYHIIHHIYPRLHWTELPSKFRSTLAQHKTERALTFRNTHFIPIALLMLTNQMEKLVRDHYVFIDWAAVKREGGEVPITSLDKEVVPTVGEVVADLERRLSYIPPYDRKIQ
ncbi:unnamed protein product [Amoebophrya sp. A120]|nr:unnamed protein product [Amoebophrya sp. A120]|eukprot:GSA120T00004700001.1